MTVAWMSSLLEDIRSRCIDDLVVVEGLERMSLALESLEHYVFRSQELERLSDEIFDVSTNFELSEYLATLSSEAGFRYASIIITEYGSRSPRGARMITTEKNKWIDRFLEEQWFFTNPIIEKARTADGPIFLNVRDETGGEKNCHIEDGEGQDTQANTMALSVHMPDGVKGVVCFNNQVNDAITNLRKHHKLFDIFHVSRDLLLAFVELNSISVDIDELSGMEKEFLSVLAYSPDPVQALSILPNFGSNSSLQQSLMRKLKAETLFQAAAVAGKIGLVDYVNPRRGDIVRSSRSMFGFELIEKNPDNVIESARDMIGVGLLSAKSFDDIMRCPENDTKYWVKK